MNYANKRVKILSKEHLDHVIKVTGMIVNNQFKENIEKRANQSVNIYFNDRFDHDGNSWFWESAKSGSQSPEEIFIPLPDPQRVVNDIKGRLNLDHLTDDELVDHLCGDHGKEWDGVEPLCAGHVVDRGNVCFILGDQACVNKGGKLDTYLIEDISPVKSKAELLVNALVNRMISYYGNPKAAEQYKGLAEAIVNDEDIKRLQS